MDHRGNKTMPVTPPEIIQQGSEEAFSSEGVDLTLIRWMLSLTPEERLEVLQNNVRAILRLRRENREP